MYWIDDTAPIRNARQMNFFLDSDADKDSLPTTTSRGVQQGLDTISCLPCGKGSAALSIASSKVFILNSNDKWIEIGW